MAIADSATEVGGHRELLLTRSLDTTLRGLAYYVLVVDSHRRTLYHSPAESQLEMNEREALGEIAGQLGAAASLPSVARLGSRRIALSVRNVPPGSWPDARLVVGADDPDTGLAVFIFGGVMCLAIVVVALGTLHMQRRDALGPRRRISSLLPPPAAPGSQPVYDDPSTWRTAIAVGLGVIGFEIALASSLQGVPYYLAALFATSGSVAFLYNWRTEASIADTNGAVSLSLALAASLSLPSPLYLVLVMWCMRLGSRIRLGVPSCRSRAVAMLCRSIWRTTGRSLISRMNKGWRISRGGSSVDSGRCSSGSDMRPGRVGFEPVVSERA